MRAYPIGRRVNNVRDDEGGIDQADDGHQRRAGGVLSDQGLWARTG
jgi:hypothetical protein